MKKIFTGLMVAGIVSISLFNDASARYSIPDFFETCPSHGTATEVENKIYEFEYGKGGVIDMKTEINIDGQCFRLKFDDKSIEEFKDSVTLSDTHLESIKVELEKTLENDRKILEKINENIASGNTDYYNYEEQKERVQEFITKKETLIGHITENSGKLSLHNSALKEKVLSFLEGSLNIDLKNKEEFVWESTEKNYKYFWKHGGYIMGNITKESYRLRDALRKILHDSYTTNSHQPKLTIGNTLDIGDHYIDYTVCREPRKHLHPMSDLGWIPTM